NEKTIEDAVRSVLSQSYQDIEYIIIDGKSSDRTNEKIKKYISNIDIYISERDMGIYDAMNKGVNLASGDILGILNSDDIYYDNEVISDVVSEFKKNKDLNIVYGNLVYVETENTDKVIRKWRSKNYYSKFFEQGNVPPHPALFVRREVYNECGLFNWNYKLAADYDFMLRIFKKFGYSSKYVPRLMVKMRLGGATNKSIKNIIKGNKEIIKSWKSNGLKAPLMLMPRRLFKRLIQFV
ncbi:MAG: glycosyl transferase family 2, partial [Mucilaginibacter sp.]|nr:glycosyl transferase family 2 [Mucilaginibacter sp.]